MKKIIAIIFAFLAASFYAINIPLSKIFVLEISPTILAGLLYFGAGIGIGICFAINRKKIKREDLLDKSDIKYVIWMIVLDVIAPILLMFGIKYSFSGNVSLLNNFEIVATSIIALVFFNEKISLKLWIAIILIIISSALLTFNFESLNFSIGSILVIGSSICWGFENNCTRSISNKSSLEIVTIKGLCCGIISLLLGLITGETINNWIYVIFALILGFFSYGISIFLYIKSQSMIGAAKTSAFYAVNPFIGAFFSLILLHEELTSNFFIALIIMIIGTFFIILDIIKKKGNNEK